MIFTAPLIPASYFVHHKHMPCPICRSLKTKPWYRLPETEDTYRRCHSCSVVFLDHPPQDQRAHYETVFYEEGYTGKNHDYSYRLRMLDEHVGRKGSLLEIGCGDGVFLKQAQKAGWRVQGVEPSERAVLVARSHGVPVTHGTLDDVPRTEPFDCVTMYHVLEHVPKPKEALARIYSLLKPNGILVLELPNPYSIDYLYSQKLLRKSISYPHHLYLFPAQLVRKMLTSAGFRIRTTAYSKSASPWKRLVRSMLPGPQFTIIAEK